MPKKKSGLSTHDRKVRELAKKYVKEKWKVKADISSFDQPTPVGSNRRIPDLELTKGGKTKLIEVDIPNTVNQEQLESFRRSAGQKKNTDFEHVITKPRKKKG